MHLQWATLQLQRMLNFHQQVWFYAQTSSPPYPKSNSFIVWNVQTIEMSSTKLRPPRSQFPRYSWSFNRHLSFPICLAPWRLSTSTMQDLTSLAMKTKHLLTCKGSVNHSFTVNNSIERTMAVGRIECNSPTRPAQRPVYLLSHNTRQLAPWQTQPKWPRAQWLYSHSPYWHNRWKLKILDYTSTVNASPIQRPSTGT